ncbi:hypothetical protein LG274_02615 [Micrococcus antarcticus]|uniref:hypothetical protein n=1 Tax=Micrococcus antarcticus TaxID=86171 RepID=UPI00384E81FB
MSALSNALRAPAPRPARVTCPAGLVQIRLAVEDPEAYEALEAFYAAPARVGRVGDQLTPPRVRQALIDTLGVDVPSQTIGKHRGFGCSCSREKLDAAIAAAREEAGE